MYNFENIFLYYLRISSAILVLDYDKSEESTHKKTPIYLKQQLSKFHILQMEREREEYL